MVPTPELENVKNFVTVAKWPDSIDTFLLNPGSVSIPKEGNPATYAVLENSIFTIKDFDGNTVREMRLP